MNDRDRLIRERAYEIWQREGHPDGRSSDHWQQALREVEAELGREDDESQAMATGRVPDLGGGPERPKPSRGGTPAVDGLTTTAPTAEPGKRGRTTRTAAAKDGEAGGDPAKKSRRKPVP